MRVCSTVVFDVCVMMGHDWKATGLHVRAFQGKAAEGPNEIIKRVYDAALGLFGLSHFMRYFSF